MRTFTVRNRMSLLSEMAMVLCFGVLPIIAMITPGGEPVSFIFCAIIVLALLYVLRSIHTVRVGSDGSVRFERLLGSTQVHVRDISFLEGFRKNEYDGTVWNMHVQYRGGTVTLPFFPGAEMFAQAVRTLEPRVRVYGEWPTLNPWGVTA